MSKQHGDNHRGPLGQRPKLVIPEDVNQLEISDEAKKAVKALDSAIAQAKFNLGNVEYQIAQLYKQRDAAIENIDKTQKMFADAVVASAKSLGIPTDDPTKGKWNFDATTMVFTKTG
jgi:hypothetical protein